MNPLEVSCKIDMRGLNNGLAAIAGYTKRTLPQMVNTAAYWVAVNAKNGLPFVTPEKVNTELGVVPVEVIGKRGKPLKKKKFGAGMSPLQRSKEAPLAALIIAARANPSSNYNALTNNRYALSKNPFAGVSRSMGRAAMAALVDKMTKLRRKSGKFLVAGWIPAIRKLFPLSAQRFLRGGSSPMEGAKNFYGANLGDARPAIGEGYAATATIENDVGMAGANAANFNRALLTYGVPSLQSAVDREGEKNMQYALSKMGKELSDEVNPHWK